MDELRAALKEAELRSRADDLAEDVSLHVHSVSRDDVDAIVTTLSRLGSIASSAEVPIELFVDDVCEAIKDGKHRLDLSPSQKQQLKSRLATLLDNKAILIAAKARLVFIEHEHYLCYARIMTDVRPVFGPDVKTAPAAAMIAHTLKLVYHHGDDTKEFFVALDPLSLDRLSDLIERAKAKEATLNQHLASQMSKSSIENNEPAQPLLPAVRTRRRVRI